MKKIIYTILVTGIFSMVIPLIALAEDKSMSFTFDLTADGQNTKEVKNGDIITVVLKLHRTDLPESYTMYAMQDEIRYDSTFLEVVEGSTVLENGITTTDIAMVDRYREFYMNYLSMSGGMKWNSDMLIGSVQFRVIGKSGVTQITNQDYLVSLKDGSDSYFCEAEDITIILSTDCVVRFMTNGGSEIADQTVQYGEKIIEPDKPLREEFCFTGWYTDINLTDKWNFDEDVVEKNMTLYAKWVPEDANQSENKKVFICIGVCIFLLATGFIIIKKGKVFRSQKR